MSNDDSTLPSPVGARSTPLGGSSIPPSPIDAMSPPASAAPKKRRFSPRLIGIAAVGVLGAGGFVASKLDSKEGIDELSAGECISVPASGRFEDVTVVDCAKDHTEEVYKVGTVTADTEVEVAAACEVDAPLLAVLEASIEPVDVSYLIGEDGKGRVVCLLTSSTARTGSFVAEANG